jgi:DNA-binding transcriptional ArsR family regulator
MTMPRERPASTSPPAVSYPAADPFELVVEVPCFSLIVPTGLQAGDQSLQLDELVVQDVMEQAGLGQIAGMYRSLRRDGQLWACGKVVVGPVRGLRSAGASGPARVVDLAEAVGLAQSTVSKHLACQRDCGLVDSEPVGRLTRPELVDMLTAAQTVLQ